jgi:hypothetical protein
MKLNKFSVRNYRSIASQSDINLQSFNVLLGKNNEGKSNLLKALNIAMETLLKHGHRHNTILSRANSRRDLNYDWARDFPFQYRDRKLGRESIFTLEFRLNNEEIMEFRDELGLQVNGIIRIRITYDENNKANIEVKKQHGTQYKKKSSEIARFISSKIKFNYISAIRTENMAINVLRNIVIQRLTQSPYNEEYEDAVKKIEEIQEKVLNDIASQLKPSLLKFLPKLNSVNIKSEVDRYNPYYWSPDIQLMLDDGVETNIIHKGEGIKSLVTLAILKDLQIFNGVSIVAIEEPESHLHSEAIHELVEVIHEISNSSQVIITTHNPLFVQRNNIKGNIIVDSGKARIAHSIEEIRSILGVMPEDNLQNTSNVLLVEGKTDQIVLSKLLSTLSLKIKNSLNNNHFVIKYMGSASNLCHTIGELNQSMCKVLVVLDNDSAGHSEGRKAIERRLIKEQFIKYIGGPGSREAELEDIIRPDFYKDLLLSKFYLNIESSAFRGNKKWSEKLKSLAISAGTDLTDSLKNEIKVAIAESIPSNINSIDDIFIKERLHVVESIVTAVEQMLE